MLNKEIPFLRIGLPLCLGIISGLFIQPGIYFIIFLVIICISGLLLSLFFNRQPANYVFGPAIASALFTCGLILITNEKKSLTLLNSEQTVFISTLSDYPQEKENTFMLTVRLYKKKSGDGLSPVKGSILLYHKKDSSIRSLLPGDILIIRCTPIEIVNRGNPCEFNYKFYMESRGIRHYAFTDNPDLVFLHSPEHRKLKYKALIVRDKIIKMYEERGIKGERLALVSAITLGQKNMLDPEQKQSYVKAGVMHIMAVSGLHTVILSLFVFNLLFFLKGKYNILRVIITLVILWAFAFVTGLSPSVLRATLMFSFLQAGYLMNRHVNGINSVLVSAFVLILVRPSVISDAGFLLSYAAVIYIIGFYQDLYLMFNFKMWLPDKIWQSAVITLVAQAGTLPLTITLFNRFPTYFLLTNIIIVPLSSILIIVGCLVPLTFPILPVSQLLASVLDQLTGLTELLTKKAASLPFSTIDNIGMTPVECILLTLAISITLVFLFKKQSVSIKYPVIAFIFFAATGTIKEINNRHNNELIVYNTPGYSTVGIKTGHMLNLYTENTLIPPAVTRHCATSGLRVNFIKSDERYHFIKTGYSNILITDSLRNDWLRENTFNFIILTGSRPFVERNISYKELQGITIITSLTPSLFNLPVHLSMHDKNIIWSVRKSGAYHTRL